MDSITYRFRIYRHIKHKCNKTYKQRYFNEKYVFDRWQKYHKLSLSVSHLDLVRELVIVREFFKRWNCNVSTKSLPDRILNVDGNYDGNNPNTDSESIFNSSADLLALAMTEIDGNDDSHNTSVSSDPLKAIHKNPIHEQFKNLKLKRQQKKEDLHFASIEQNLIRRKRISNALNYQNPSIK
jgi:hypothetical protein